MSQGIELTSVQREVLRRVLSGHAAKLDRVCVYGSRAMGRARPGSDVDLVLFGRLDSSDGDRIRAELEDSSLSIDADVTVYGMISHAPLRAEIDRWAKPLFERADLLPGAAHR